MWVFAVSRRSSRDGGLPFFDFTSGRVEDMVLDNSLAAEVRRYREGMARSLANLAGMVAETERSLSAQGLDLDSIDLESELTSEKARRMHCTTCGLLLRKGKIHMVGAYRANETDNLHSLAVQMRPVLECAGQAHDMGLIAMGGLEHGGKKALARLGYVLFRHDAPCDQGICKQAPIVFSDCRDEKGIWNGRS